MLTQVVKHRFHGFGGAGEGAVDAFGGEQDRADDAESSAQLEQARAHLESTLALLEEERDVAPEDPVRVRGDLAEVCLELGDLDAAERLLATALEELRAIDGDTARLALKLEARRAHLAVQRRDADAEERLLDVLARQAGVAPDGERATTLSHLAGLYQQGGRAAEAEPLYAEALALWEGIEERETASMLRVRNNLVVLLHGLGRIDDAKGQLADVLVASRELLGPEHPDTVATLNNLAALEHATGNPARAAELFREALPLLGDQLPAEHPLVVTTKANLGTIECQLGNFAAGEPLLEEVLEYRRRMLGETDERTLSLRYELASARLAQDDPEGFHDGMLEGFELALEGLGEGHRLFARFEIELARGLMRVGELDDAEALLLEARAAHAAGERSTERAGVHEVDELLLEVTALREDG